MTTRYSSGLQDSDIYNIKVFLRTYNDAISCAEEIANIESARDHYKSYVKVLIKALKQDQVNLAKSIHYHSSLVNDW